MPLPKKSKKTKKSTTKTSKPSGGRRSNPGGLAWIGASDPTKSNGEWIRPGRYRLRIEGLKHGPTRKSGDGFFVETVCMETAKTDPDVRNHAKGEPVTWGTFSKHDAFAGNVKSFFLALFDMTDAEAKEDPQAFDDRVNEAIGEDQPYAGEVLDVVAWNTETKSGNDFTLVKWYQSDEDDDFEDDDDDDEDD